MENFQKANQLLVEFKADRYLHGQGVLVETGRVAAQLGRSAVLVLDDFPGAEKFTDQIRASLMEAGVRLLAEIPGSAPNAPLEDLERIRAALRQADPELVISFGGGSTIDCVKSAEILRVLGDEIGRFFGTGLVTQALAEQGKELHPHLAIQTAASSSAHLTKYSNITDLVTGQKKLLVDEAIVPVRALFDYSVTAGAPPSLTIDGGLDGISHALEVWYSAVGKSNTTQIEAAALEAIRLVVNYLPQVMDDPHHLTGREALGLATDLGGYCIMLGGTNGAHLTSFSLVDILSHGRACGLMNPYYTVFFSPAIQEPLRKIAGLYQAAGYLPGDSSRLQGRELAEAVARAMFAFARRVGMPTTLSEVPGFSSQHIARALTAAKNPQLKMKLENMPVPLRAEQVDDYMGPILQAAVDGDISRIRNL